MQAIIKPSPGNRKELFDQISALRLEVKEREYALTEHFSELKSKFKIGQVLKYIGRSVFTHAKGSPTLASAGISAGVGLLLRNFIFPVAAKRVVGSVAVAATQNLLSNVIIDNKEKLGKWMDNGLYYLKHTFSRDKDEKD